MARDAGRRFDDFSQSLALGFTRHDRRPPPAGAHRGAFRLTPACAPWPRVRDRPRLLKPSHARAAWDGTQINDVVFVVAHDLIQKVSNLMGSCSSSSCETHRSKRPWVRL